MQKKLIIYLSIILSLFWTQSSYAICPTGPVTASVSSTASTCGGNGTVTVKNVSPTAGVSLQLLKGGVLLNHVANATSPYTWSSLQAGTDYQVRIVCAENNNTIYQTLDVTVAENYVPISTANISVTDVCTNFTPGGTISVNEVTGGSAPYKYSFYLSNDPAYDDTLSTYGTSNTMSVSQFGTYQIRVKDACGNYKTFTRTIASTLDPIQVYWTPSRICSSNQNTGTYSYAWNPVLGGSNDIANYDPQGIMLEIRDTNASGAVLFSGKYTGQQITYTESASHLYWVTSTNACGISTSYIVNNQLTETYDFKITSSSSGCGASATMFITTFAGGQTYWNYPVTVTIKNSGGTTVYTHSFNDAFSTTTASNLPFGDYTVTYTDTCGNTLTKPVTNPTTAGAPVLSVHSFLKWLCVPGMPAVTQNGTIQALLQVSGYLPDRTNAVLTIINGPSNVGVQGTLIDNEYWGWSNIVQGTYTVQITSCAQTYTQTFTAGPNEAYLNQSLTSTGTSFCSGGGNIISTKVYNGDHPAFVELLDSADNIVQTSTDGSFYNIPSGTYTTRMRITYWCNSVANTYYIPGSTVVLTDSTTGPVITSSTGVVCEDANGNPLSTGSAFLNLAGVAPYKIEYKKTTEPTWTTINNAPANTTLNGLTANTIYNVRLTDACGGTYNTTVNIKTMGSLSSVNTVQPCYNSPYVLSMENYAGATYEWTNPQGTVVSNTRTYPIANYTSAYDGTYVCKITWTNCVTRYVNVTLNGNLCGQPLGFIDAVNDINQVPAGSTVTGNVLTNDETTGLTVQSATYYNNVSGIVTPLQLGTATPIYTAAGVLAGTMTLNADGSYTFASSSTFSGDVPVNYTAVNAEGSTDTATLEIKVIPVVSAGNANPIAQNDTATTEAGVSVTSNALANDSDPNGNPLTITAATQGATTLVVNGSTPNTVSGVDSAGNPVANAGTLVLNPNGTYTFVPAAGFTGTIDPLTYTISDGNGGTDTAVINISVYPNSGNNVFANDDANSSPKGSTMNGNVLTNDFDPENNTFTVTAATANGTTITVGSPTLIPGIGTLTLNSNGTYTFVPLPDFVGTVVIPYTICDDGIPQACDEATLYLTSLDRNACYNDAYIGAAGMDTKHGITLLQRAGADNGNWPMIRKSAHTALESNTKGFVITRMTTAQVTAIVSPQEGMMVYDTTAKCLKLYDGTAWSCFNTPACP